MPSAKNDSINLGNLYKSSPVFSKDSQSIEMHSANGSMSQWAWEPWEGRRRWRPWSHRSLQMTRVITQIQSSSDKSYGISASMPGKAPTNTALLGQTYMEPTSLPSAGSWATLKPCAEGGTPACTGRESLGHVLCYRHPKLLSESRTVQLF